MSINSLSDNPVIGLGEPGEWDDGSRGDPSVLFDGANYHMWFAGSNVSISNYGFGHATSTDGVAWTMDPANPVLRQLLCCSLCRYPQQHLCLCYFRLLQRYW